MIRPAAYCGVVGYKPSYGTISRIGMKVMSDSLDTVGVIARSVADCALFAGAVSGRDLGDPDARPDRAPRIGMCRSPTWDLARRRPWRCWSASRRRWAAPAPRCPSANCRQAFAALVQAHPIVMNSESGRALGWELADARDRISEGLRERLEFGLGCSEAERPQALRGVRRARSGVSGGDGRAGRAGDAVGSGRGAGRAGMDRRSGVQFHLDQPARALRDGAGGRRGRTGCRWGSRSSAGRARIARCWPGRSGWRRRSGEGLVVSLTPGKPSRTSFRGVHGKLCSVN